MTISEIRVLAEEREAFLQELEDILEAGKGIMVPYYGLDLLFKETKPRRAME